MMKLEKPSFQTWFLKSTPFGYRTQLSRDFRWFLSTFQRLVGMTIFYQKWDKWDTIKGVQFSQLDRYTLL